MIPILAQTSETYSSTLLDRLGRGKIQSQIIYSEWFKKGAFTGSDPAFNNCPELLSEIIKNTDLTLPEVLTKLDENQTGKFLLRTEDNLEIESVILPMKAGWTLCVSSQIGCKMGCSFCETAKMGLIRNLSTEEIVAQLFIAIHHFKVPIRYIVFMGMGEPFDNFEAVVGAIEVFCDTRGFNLGRKHITLSTSGRVDGIKTLIEKDIGVNLAVSVNAPNDQVRNRLMPVNRSYDMATLKEAMLLYCKTLKRKIFVEYVLIEGRTDSLENAKELAEYLRDLDVTLNLIPYNPMRKGIFRAPSEEQIEAFSLAMRELGYLTFVRTTFGQRIMAACGQLGRLSHKKPPVGGF
jgi:23S rRNA (adenine2503-C2)-methyltransferase